MNFTCRLNFRGAVRQWLPPCIAAVFTLAFICNARPSGAQILDNYFHAVGDSSQSLLGASITGIGDVDHDGFDDIAVSAPGDGYTYVYYGNDVRDSVRDLRLPYMGAGLQGVGDINGDGYPDLVGSSMYEVYIVYGNATTLDTIPGDTIRPPNGPPPGFPGFGVAIAVADFDCDGVIDFVIVDRSPSLPDIWVQLHFYSGANGLVVPTWTLSGGFDGHYLYANCLAIDLDGDSAKELVVVANEYEADSFPARLFYFDGPDFDSIPDYEFFAPMTSPVTSRSGFGRVLADIGDFNKDGFSDLAAPAGSNGFLFWGGPGIWDSIPDLRLQTSPRDLAFAGDVDLDGRTDIVVGYASYAGNIGRIEIFRGESPPDSIPDYFASDPDLPSENILEFIGQYVASAGDFNNDGASDVVVTCENLGHAQWMDVFVLGIKQINSGIFDEPEDGEQPTGDFQIITYPNPSNASVIIEVSGSPVDLPEVHIYDILGRRIATLHSVATASDGKSHYSWNGKRDGGQEVASGIYFALARSNSKSATQKIVIVQ